MFRSAKQIWRRKHPGASGCRRVKADIHLKFFGLEAALQRFSRLTGPPSLIYEPDDELDEAAGVVEAPYLPRSVAKPHRLTFRAGNPTQYLGKTLRNDECLLLIQGSRQPRYDNQSNSGFGVGLPLVDDTVDLLGSAGSRRMG